MGKRKLHNLSYYQCDWTGFPMRKSNCYMPDFRDGHLFKRGHYCNWEAVVAHARHMYEVDKSLEDSDLDKILEHVKNITGIVEDKETCDTLYNYADLDHFGGNITYEDWHMVSCKTTEQVIAIKVCIDGTVKQLDMEPFDGTFDYSDYIWTATEAIHCNIDKSKIARVVTARKVKGSTHGVDIYGAHYDEELGHDKTLFNATASNHAKTNIYGDALYVLKTRENSYIPRDRAIDFTIEMYNDLFGKKRKKEASTAAALTTTQYAQAKNEMQASLTDYEARASSSAVTPQELVAGAKMPAPIGRELAVLAEHLGQERPLPSFPLAVQAAAAPIATCS